MQLLGFRELIANVQDGVVSCRRSGSGENAVVPQLREKPPVRSRPQQQDINCGIERGKHSVQRAAMAVAKAPIPRIIASWLRPAYPIMNPA